MKHYKSNVEVDGKDFGGWIICSDSRLLNSQRYSEDVEIKYSTHKPNETRGNERPARTDATAVTILIKGKFTITFPDMEYKLEEPGDYVFWEPGITHTWTADEASTMITVRWPQHNKHVKKR